MKTKITDRQITINTNCKTNVTDDIFVSLSYNLVSFSLKILLIGDQNNVLAENGSVRPIDRFESYFVFIMCRLQKRRHTHDVT